MYVPFQDNQFDPFIIWLIPNPLWVFFVVVVVCCWSRCVHSKFLYHWSNVPSFTSGFFLLCHLFCYYRFRQTQDFWGKKKSVLFSAALSLCRRPVTLSKTHRSALKFRFLLSKKFVVGKTPEEGLYSCFYGMINSNSQNFLSWVLKELIEHKTVNKVWCNS